MQFSFFLLEKIERKGNNFLKLKTNPVSSWSSITLSCNFVIRLYEWKMDTIKRNTFYLYSIKPVNTGGLPHSISHCNAISTATCTFYPWKIRVMNRNVRLEQGWTKTLTVSWHEVCRKGDLGRFCILLKFFFQMWWMWFSLY